MRRMLTACAVLILLGMATARSQAQAEPAARVVIETAPAAGAIVPDETLVTTRLRVLDAAGIPIPGARVALHVDTPPRAKVITTDFPFVEDTTLLELETVLPEGELSFQAVYPIRGTYTFRTRVVLPDGQTLEASPVLSLRENPDEVRNILVLLGLLFAFGLFSGFVIRLTGRPGAAAAAAIVALVLTGGTGWAHGPSGEGAPSQNEPVTVVREADGVRVTATASPDSAAVGRLTTVTVRATTAAGRPVAGNVSLDAIHLEDNVPIYSFDLPLEANGTARVALQLFDGTEHELRFALRTDDGRAVNLEVPLPVEGFAPPLSVKLRSLALLMVPVVVGLAVGFRAGRPFAARRRLSAVSVG